METINTTDTKKICGIFITTNSERDELCVNGSHDLITSLRNLNDVRSLDDFLPEDCWGSIDVVYWRMVLPEKLELECMQLRALGRKFLTEMINRFNPGWQDLFDVLIPKDPIPSACPHCGGDIEIYSEAAE